MIELEVCGALAGERFVRVGEPGAQRGLDVVEDGADRMQRDRVCAADEACADETKSEPSHVRRSPGAAGERLASMFGEDNQMEPVFQRSVQMENLF
jgi:hypothetical protein